MPPARRPDPPARRRRLIRSGCPASRSPPPTYQDSARSRNRGNPGEMASPGPISWLSRKRGCEPVEQRWMGVGRSADPDARAAGTEATRRALTGPDPKLLIVFGAFDYDPSALAGAVAAVAPGVPVVGCSTSGEIAPDGPGDATVVVTAIGGSGIAVATAA